MQILYWHLVQPSQSSISSSSPPLQRRSSNSFGLEPHPLMTDMASPDDVDGVGGDDTLQLDENGLPTIFYLNVDNFDDLGNVQEPGIMDVDYTHHYRVGEDGTIEYHQNGLPPPSTTTPINNAAPHYGLLPDDSQHISSIPLVEDTLSYNTHRTDQASNFSQSQCDPEKKVDSSNCNNKRKTFSELSLSFDGCASDEEDPDDGYSTSGRGKHQGLVTQTNRHSTEWKKPKLVINLYEEEIGYEFGCSEVEDPSFSHLIPYKEDSLLRSVDREEVPSALIASSSRLLDCLDWDRGHAVAHIRDFRRPAFQESLSISGTTSSSALNRNRRNMSSNDMQQQQRIIPAASLLETSKTKTPAVREVLLKPHSASILSDFDRVVERGIRERRRWKQKKLVTSNSYKANGCSTILSEDSSEDSDFEIGTNFDTSLDDAGDFLAYDERLELEKEIIKRTSGPLCLNPSPNVALIQNSMQFEKLKWHDLSHLEKSTKEKYKSSHKITSGNDSSTLRGLSTSFCQFVSSVKDKSTPFVKDVDTLKLSGVHSWEYPLIDPPSTLEEILKICPRPSASQIRHLPIDNFIKKIEEYTLETERRKRPHTTKLSIYQRNGMDCYFGELEMESIVDSSPMTSKHGGGILGKDPPSNNTKCQFELGSIRSVALYVKQFSDIFTEDGRRPCKITYQKAGQQAPQVLYTNSYKAQQPATATSGAGDIVSSSQVAAGSELPATVSTSPFDASTVSTPSQPPVQIVLPQPRSQQPEVNTNTTQQQIQQVSSTAGEQASAATSASPHYSFSASSSTTTTTPQILTRPQIISLQGGKASTSPTASQQSLIQQRLLRLKQQQTSAQGSQNPQNTALAKLLLANIQQNSSGSRPITVAVQPQPQKPTTEQSNTETVTSSAGSSINVQVGNTSSLNVNVNSKMLDAILNQQASSVANSSQTRQPVNILRVNATQQNQNQPHIAIERSATASAPGPYNLSQLLGNSASISGSQRILINANNGQQITLNAGTNDRAEELPISDLNLASLLSSSVPVTSQSTGGDTHNLNLNLNVNLNSNSMMDTGVGLTHQSQGHSQGPPPFLVFISPLRQVPVSLSQQQPSNSVQLRTGSLLQQQLNASIHLTGQEGAIVTSLPSSISNNLIALSSQQQQQNSVSSSGDVTTSSETSDLSIFNTFSDSVEFGQKLEGLTPSATAPTTIISDNPTHSRMTSNSLQNTVMIGSTSYSVNVSSSAPSIEIKKDPSIITLSDLLGSTPVSSTLGNSNLSTMILQSPAEPQLITNSANNNASRLSALLAGTPSPDTSTLGQRVGGSGLNPIASATPNVVLEHPVLAATLTSGQQSSKGSNAYRQIAPAPTNISARGKPP